MGVHDSILNDKLNKLFGVLISNASISVYPYQHKVASNILVGKNVLLRAPTGAGKTWAALLPFILGRIEGQPLFDRVLYALPLRSLAAQLYRTTQEACSRITKQEDIEAIEVTIQTGEQQDDPFFQGDIIFTTIDQLLSSYLMNPVSLSPRLANINAGALVGSLIIFDEFHLLDPDRSMGTAIEMLDRLNGYCSFILMTATLSDNAIDRLQNMFTNTITIDLPPEEIKLIESYKKPGPTNRIWVYINEEISAQAILHTHQKRTLVIANTVNRAQGIYEELRDLCRLSSQKTDIRLLHSRFYPDDRKKTELELMSRLGKANRDKEEDFIFVSTQVVEAGMDFTVDHLYSELAPINSLIQRAGRCARYGGQGKVTVCYTSSHPPYSKEDMDATAELLDDFSGRVFTWEEERDAVNRVLGEREAKVLSAYGNLYGRRERVNLAMDGRLTSAREELIRDINSVNVILTDKPELIRLDRIEGWPETLSVPISSMHSFLKKVSGSTESDWLIKAPFMDESGGEEDIAVRFSWREIDVSAMPSAWLLAVNPKYAYYSAELGLVLGKPGSGMEVRRHSRENRTLYSYKMEIYPDHVRHVLEQYQKKHQKYLCSRRILAQKLKLKEDVLEKAVISALVLHDTGKLRADWQQEAIKWQERKTPNEVPAIPLAHTDYDPSIDNGRPRFSNHAVEGAYAVFDYLLDLFSEYDAGIAACILTAIARHHTGHAAKMDSFTLDSAAASTLTSCLFREGLPGIKNLLDKPDELTRGGQFSREFITACDDADSIWLPLYWYIVRRLRLSDQAGTAEGGKK